MRENLLFEKSADYQYYQVEGTHYEIGYLTALHGKKTFGTQGMKGQERLFAEKCREIVQEYFPEMIEEFNGYANALSLTEENLLWHYSLGLQGGCSAFAVQTKYGNFVGRNYDYHYFENRRHLIHTVPRSGYASIGMHEGLVGGRFDGINQEGLFVSFNAAGTPPTSTRPGLSVQLIVRYLLEKCKDAEEAVKALLELPVKEPKSYLIADQSKAYVVEVHPKEKAVREAKNHRIIVTNHFVDDSMTKYNDVNTHSRARYSTINSSIEEILRCTEKDEIINRMKGLLTIHDPPVCGHMNGHATFWSCISMLSSKQIYYCLGAPCRNPYIEYFKI